MTRQITLALVALAVLAPQSALALKPKPAPPLPVKIEQSPKPTPAGKEATVKVSISAPDGITLDRYPGLTLKIGETGAAKVAGTEFFIGLKKAPENLDDNVFTTIEPFVLKVTASKSTEIEAKLKFFYCVKASGYCAPGEQAIKIPISTK